MERPSKKELFGKLRDAKSAVRNDDVLLIDQDVIAEDAIELGYDIGSELMEVLRELLEGTSLNHYAGPVHRKSPIKGKSKAWSFFLLRSRVLASNAGSISSLLSVEDRFGWYPCIRTAQ